MTSVTPWDQILGKPTAFRARLIALLTLVDFALEDGERLVRA